MLSNILVTKGKSCLLKHEASALINEWEIWKCNIVMLKKLYVEIDCQCAVSGFVT